MKRPGFVSVILIFILTWTAGQAAGASGSDPDRLYVVVSPEQETGASAVVAFDVEADGIPQQRQSYETGGLGRAFTSFQEVIVDPIGRFLFACNNESDNVSAFSILDDGTLDPVPGSPFPVGTVPARFALHPSQRILYVGNSLDSTIGVYTIEDDGALTEKQTAPSPFIRDMEVDPEGRYLYAVDMFGAQGIRVYEISDFGTLKEISGSPYTYPRADRTSDVEIQADGSRLVVLDLDQGLVVFDIDDWGGLDLVGGPWPVSGFANALLLSQRYAYVGIYYSPQIDGFAVGPNGTPIALDRSPFPAENGVVKMLNPRGTARLYEVSREQQNVSTFARGAGGGLTPLADPVAVQDPDGRVPNGAAYLREVKPPVASYGE